MTVSDVAAYSAGARRANVAFDASTDHPGRRLLRLVATILLTSAIELNPIRAQAAIRNLAAEHGVPVPKVYAACEDSSYVGGPFFVSARVDGETVPRRVLRLVVGVHPRQPDQPHPLRDNRMASAAPGR